MKAKGKRIPQWIQEANGLVGAIQKSPVRSDEPIEDVTLIPMGCARLRIAAFPQIGEGPDASVLHLHPQADDRLLPHRYALVALPAVGRDHEAARDQ